MKTFQTQCPSCRHVFTITDSQLDFKNGMARCGHCKQIFSAKDHLMTPQALSPNQQAALADLKQQKSVLPTSLPTPVPTKTSEISLELAGLASANPVTVPNKKAKRVKTGIDLISDDNVPEDLSAELGLDNLNHGGHNDWDTGRDNNNRNKNLSTTAQAISSHPLTSQAIPIPTQATSAQTTLTQTTSAQKVATPSSEFELDILEDFDLPSSPTLAKPTATQTTPTSKSDAPSYFDAENQADIPDKNDEAWLDKMLADEQQKEKEKSFLADSRRNPVGAKSDMTDLLEEFGVGVATEPEITKETYLQKLSERLEHKPTSQQRQQKPSYLSPILWGLGCLLLLGLLVAQYVIFNVNSLIKNPAHAQTLANICQATHLACHLPQADLAAVNIKTLSLEGNGNKTDLLFVLTNKSSESVLYPNLKISLQRNNSNVNELVLSPRQYLDEPTEQLAPAQIKPIKFRLDVPRDKFEQAVIEGFY